MSGRIFRILLVTTAIALGQGNVALATTANVSDDAFTSSRFPNRNFGDSEALELLEGGPPANTETRIVFVKFSMNGVPPGIEGSDIRFASLTLFGEADDSVEIDVDEVLEPWQENDLTDATSPTLGATVATVQAGPGQQFVTADVTQLVAAWVDDPSLNHGLALRLRAGAGPIIFDSKENQRTAHEPTLKITLGDNGVPPGSLLLWEGDMCPLGFTAVEHEGRFIRISHTPNAVGGTESHQHGPGTFGIQSSGQVQPCPASDLVLVDDNAGGTDYWLCNGNHTHPLGGQQSGSQTPISGTSDSASSLPPFVSLMLCKKS